MHGIHYQVIQPQAKLVWASSGVVLDPAIHLRRSSPNFGRHVAVELNSELGQLLYIPVGFGHGFAAFTDNQCLAYKVTDYYCLKGERTILWNDAGIGIPWPISADIAILSDKDLKGSSLREAEVFA